MFEIHVHILVLLPFLSFTCMMIHTFHGGFHHRKQIHTEYSKCKRKYSNVNKSMCIKKIKKWYKRKSRQINETTKIQKYVNRELWIAGVLLVKASNDYLPPTWKIPGAVSVYALWILCLSQNYLVLIHESNFL